MKANYSEDGTVQAFSAERHLKSVPPLKTKLRVMRDLVAIRRLDQREFSDGGIALVKSEDFREDIGEIVAAGEGRNYQCKCGELNCIPMSVKVGDKIIFSPNGHQLTELNGEQLIVLRQDSIIGVIE